MNLSTNNHAIPWCLKLKAQPVIGWVIGLAGGLGVATGFAYSFEIFRQTIDAGGVLHSSAGPFELSGTIGQPDAGVLSGGAFELTGGFWFEEPPGDCNATGAVELLDFSKSVDCMTGPETGIGGHTCYCFDVDRDGDADLFDVATLQRFYTGE